MPDIKYLNNYLSNFGKCDNSDGPLFRLVWSDKETEMRHGTFREFLGPIFLREITAVKEVKKYPWIKERWILERWIPGIYANNPELPLSKWGSYEPIYTFVDQEGNYLEPNLKVLEILMCQIHADRPSAQARLSELAEMEAKKESKEVQYFMDAIDVSEIGNAIRMGEAVGYTKESKQIN